MSKSSPRKAQWGMHQHSQRRDPSPSGAQWDASITLRAVQSESLQMRNPSNVQKYPPSPTSSNFPSSSSSSLGTTTPGTMTNASSSIGSMNVSSNRTTMSNSTDSIAQQNATDPRGRSGFKQNGFHSYSLSVDTAKAQQQQQQHQSALGLFRSMEATSPTSTAGSQYHYWRGGDSPALMKGSEPPLIYAERRPSWTLEQVSSTARGAPLLSPTATGFENYHMQHKKAESQSNPLDSIQMIEQEAKALMLLRSESGQKIEKYNTPVKPLRISSRTSQGGTDYSSKEKQTKPEGVRFDESRPTTKRSVSVELTPSTSRPSFFKKAFGSPQKSKEKTIKEEKRQTNPTRSIVRSSHSSSSLRGKQREHLTRMISAPTLVETSSTASPVQEQMGFKSYPSPKERMEELQKTEDAILGLSEQPKRRKRAPPPPPPRRKHSESSTVTQSTRSPVSPIAPLTPPEGGDAIVGYIDESQNRKGSVSTIRRKPSVQMTEDFSLIGHMPLDYINGVGKERKLSNTESLGSIYDQESWSGHTPQENEIKMPSPTFQQSKNGSKSRGRKKSDLSPLVQDRIIELQEPDTSVDHSDISNSQDGPSHLVYLEEINDKRRPSQVQNDKRASVYEDADSGSASNEESWNTESDSESPIIVKRRPSSPRYYKIVRTTDEDSKEMEYLDSIHLYDEASLSEQEESGDRSSSSLTDSIERANSSLTTAEQEEIDRFVKNYGKNIRSVRASALMDLDDASQRPLSFEKVWQEKQEGKRSAISFILATISETMTYLTPIKFKDIHQIRTSDEAGSPNHLEQFHMESLKDNCERLFLASVPMYEMMFERLWHISHWTKKLDSLAWCTTFFTLWYCDALIPGALAIFIFKIVNERESGKKRGNILSSEELESRSKMLEQFSEGVKTESSLFNSSVTSSPTLAGDEKSFTPTSEVSNALRNHTQSISNLTAKVADIHERMYNMSRWSHTPATIRTLIIVGLIMIITLFLNASQIIHGIEFIFGVHFFIIAPILSRFKFLSDKNNFSILSFFDFVLSGVPNDAQNALLIMRKSNMNQSFEDELTQKDKRQGIANFDDDVIIQPSHARGASYQSQEESQAKISWAAKETTFTATYDDQIGLLTISSQRLTFRTGGPSFIVLLDIELQQIAQLDKVRKASIKDSSIRNEGLRFTVKEDQAANPDPIISNHTFLNMNLRDEAFNRVLALAPQRWHKQVGINVST
ncbi:hypothetical protein L7F22_068265 [Adiantum nelumboides]|nr:hypothetical protein [Adiantum nelumboides]